MGVDPLHFSEVDYSSAQSDFNRFHSSTNYANKRAFAAVKADGSIKVWGSPYDGGTGAPSGRGYTKIYSNWGAFAALKAPSSLMAAKARLLA
jgi:hypothetical protein